MTHIKKIYKCINRVPFLIRSLFSAIACAIANINIFTNENVPPFNEKYLTLMYYSLAIKNNRTKVLPCQT